MSSAKRAKLSRPDPEASSSQQGDIACDGACRETSKLRWAVKTLDQPEVATAIMVMHNVVPGRIGTKVCPRCGHIIQGHNGKMWKCYNLVKKPKKKAKRCSWSQSVRSGTFFSGSHLAADKLLLFCIYYLMKDFSYPSVITDLGFTNKTICDWRSFCSEVCQDWVERKLEKIGGVDVVVEIDEALLCKRKYNRGRVLEELWIFGGIERVSKKKFAVPVVKRDKIHLYPEIHQWIKPGSVVYCDKWKAYDKLDEEGYLMGGRINHSEYFVDPENSAVHTQNIERMWKDVKSWVLSQRGGGTVRKHATQYLARWLFCRSHKEEDRLHEFLSHAALLYPSK